MSPRALLVAPLLLALAAAQVPCPMGSSLQSGACAVCPVSSFSTAVNSAICTPCPAGTTGPAGSTSAMQCAPCASNTYSLGSSSACAPCAPAYSFVGAATGCAPPQQSGPLSGLAWAFSGAQSEGVGAFAINTNPSGVSFVADRLGTAAAAMQLASGAVIGTPVAPAPAGFPTGSSAASISAWVNCAPFTSNPQASVVEW